MTLRKASPPGHAHATSMEQPADDYDTPWKTAVMRYFREFMAFFFPQAHDAIDWKLGYRFLDQELARIARDARLGHRRLDKLVQVNGRDGESQLLYIHLEIQRRRETDFAARIFTYHYRLYDRFQCPITTLVILADPHPAWRPDWFGYDALGCETSIHYPTVKLMDYWPHLEKLLASHNAFAILTVAHLMTLHTRHQHQLRFEWKARLATLMHERQWSTQRILDLFDVLDWMMAIPSPLQKQLGAKVIELERSMTMPFENLIIKMHKERARQEGLDEGREEGRQLGMEEGREEGREEGLLTGHREALTRLLKLRFGPLSLATAQRIEQASKAELADWESRILRAGTLDDVFDSR